MPAIAASRHPVVRRIIVWSGAAACAAVLANAQTQTRLDVKPGLWEIVTTSKTNGGPTMDMSGLSESQRAQMGAMMQRMQGQMQAPTKDRICVSADPSKPAFEPPAPKDSKCKRAIVSSSADAEDSTFECTGQSSGKGQTHVDRDSDATVHGHGTITIEQQHVSMAYEFTGKWVAESCGNVK